jgi:hypothetical protein
MARHLRGHFGVPGDLNASAELCEAEARFQLRRSAVGIAERQLGKGAADAFHRLAEANERCRLARECEAAALERRDQRRTYGVHILRRDFHLRNRTLCGIRGHERHGRKETGDQDEKSKRTRHGRILFIVERNVRTIACSTQFYRGPAPSAPLGERSPLAGGFDSLSAPEGPASGSRNAYYLTRTDCGTIPSGTRRSARLLCARGPQLRAFAGWAHVVRGKAR